MSEATVLVGDPGLAELDADGVLAAARASVRQRRGGELRPLTLALRWAGLHPATTDDRARWCDLLRTDLGDEEAPADRVGGLGAPEVKASCISEFATALRTGDVSAAQLIQDTLDLALRLPLCWAAMCALRADAWRARMVARLTHHLSLEACARVDQQLARRLDAVGPITIKKIVGEAILRFHPDLAAEAVRRGKAGWHVTLHHPDQVDFTSTSELCASADSLDLEDFDEALALAAEQRRLDGDTDSLDQRRAKAMGDIGRAMTGRPARPAQTEPDEESLDETTPGESLDLDAAAPDPAIDPESSPSTRLRDRPGLDGLDGLASSAKPRRRKPFVMHVRLADAATSPHSGPPDTTPVTIYDAGRHGLVTEAVLDRWLTSKGARATKVIDTSRNEAVDQHDPPAWMRAQVIERDRHCAFPRCRVPAEDCDLDHITRYDSQGPPGQTSPDKLACLCRRHHLGKTFAGWHYQRLPDGGYLWTSPHGWQVIRTKNGETYELGAVPRGDP